MRTEQNFDLISGDSKFIYVSVKNKDGAAQDLSEIQGITWVVKKRATSVNVVLSKDLTNDILIVDAINGRFRIQLNPDDTELLSGYYYHEAQLTDNGGNITTVMSGNVVVTDDGVV